MLNDFRALLQEHGGLIILCFLLIFFSVFGQSVLFGVYLPDIQSALDLSKTSIGSLYAIATIASSIVIIYTGKALDFMPLRNFVAIVLIGLAIGCFALSLASNMFMLLVAFFLLRHFGQGLMTLSSGASINRYIEKGRGKAVAFASFGASVQVIVFPVLALKINEYMSWQQAWVLYGVFTLLVLLPAFWLYLKTHQITRHAAWEKRTLDREKNATDADLSGKQWTRIEVLKNWRIYAILSITMISPFVGTVIFFYQAELAASLGLTQISFATSFSFLTIAAIISSVISGISIDIYGEKPALITYPILYATGLFFLTRDGGLASSYIGMSFLGGATGIMITTGGPLLAKLYGTKYMSSIKSITHSSAILASALSPFMFGYLMDAGVEIRTLLSYIVFYSATIWILAFPICKNLPR